MCKINFSELSYRKYTKTSSSSLASWGLIYLRESFYAIYPKIFSDWFLSRNGGRKHKFVIFLFLKEVIVCQSHSVLTDYKRQNLPSLGSYCEMYDVKFEHSVRKSDHFWSNGINQGRTCYLSQHFNSSHINKILVF